MLVEHRAANREAAMPCRSSDERWKYSEVRVLEACAGVAILIPTLSTAYAPDSENGAAFPSKLPRV